MRRLADLEEKHEPRGMSAMSGKQKRDAKSRIPGADEWRGYESDLDVKYAHKLFFGKSVAEVQEYFGSSQSIERADELLFMPRAAFQYYVLAFAMFIMSDQAIGDSDSASSFLRLLINREKKDAGSVSTIYLSLQDTVELVASHQQDFDADIDIYGNFPELANEIHELVGAAPRPT